MGSVAKSNMRKRFQIYEEMRKYLTIYEEAVSHKDFATDPFWISLYMRKIWFSFFISVQYCAHHNHVRPYENQSQLNFNG